MFCDPQVDARGYMPVAAPRLGKIDALGCRFTVGSRLRLINAAACAADAGLVGEHRGLAEINRRYATENERRIRFRALKGTATGRRG